MRPSFAWALTLVLAGCLSTPHPGGADRPLPRGTPTFAAPMTIDGFGAGETFVAVGAGGLVLACTHGGFTGPSPLWISHDDGATWKRVTPTPNPIPDGDCDVEVSPGGELAMIFDYVAGSSVAVSRDAGATWTVNHVAAPPVTGVVDRPWIAYVGERLLLSYKAVGAQPGVVVARYSDDQGATWTVPSVVSVADDVERFEQLSLDFLVGADGTVRIPLVSEANDPATPVVFRFAVSSDRGSSWRIEPALGPLASDSLVAAGVAGAGDVLYWAWHDRSGNLMEAHSTDGGRNWFDPVAVAHATTIWTPALAGRADGAAVLFWLQSGPDQAMVTLLDAAGVAAAASPQVLEGPSGRAQMAEFSDVAVGADGLARIVYDWDAGDSSCMDTLHPTSTCERFVRQLS